MGAFKYWLQLPDQVTFIFRQIESFRPLKQCNYRGIPTSKKDCLCLPSWSGDYCEGRIKGTLTLREYKRTSVQIVKYLPVQLASFVAEWTLLEVLLVATVGMQLVWRLFGVGSLPTLYRYTTLCASDINIFSHTIPSILLCHFTHPSLLHFIWSLSGIWTIVRPFYSFLGGREFFFATSFGLLFIAMFKLGSDLMERTVRDRRQMRPLYGLQYFFLCISVCHILMQHGVTPMNDNVVAAVMKLFRRPPPAAQLWPLAEALGRLLLQTFLFEQMATGQLYLHMHFASVFAGFFYCLVVRQFSH